MPTLPSRLMVIANHTGPSPELPEQVLARLSEQGEVYVVMPALNTRLRHYMSDTDQASAAAHKRLEATLAQLREAGIKAEGKVGDADPLHAIEDALTLFSAESVLISTWPKGVSNWLARDLLERARASLKIPVQHIITPYGSELETGRI